MKYLNIEYQILWVWLQYMCNNKYLVSMKKIMIESNKKNGNKMEKMLTFLANNEIMQ